ncbi:MAG: sigma-70 family RNA polymerase sigma factor [Jatrophihabitantaceae bacterium]
MRHTDEEIDRAAARFEQLADELDPATAQAEHTDDLRQIAVASDMAREDEARLREAVQLARAHGRSWNQIAVALGVSRQAARQRFVDKVGA